MTYLYCPGCKDALVLEGLAAHDLVNLGGNTSIRCPSTQYTSPCRTAMLPFPDQDAAESTWRLGGTRALRVMALELG